MSTLVSYFPVSYSLPESSFARAVTVHHPRIFRSYVYEFPVSNKIHSITKNQLIHCQASAHFCTRFCGLKSWFLQSFKLQHLGRKRHTTKEVMCVINQEDDSRNHFETSVSLEGKSEMTVHSDLAMEAHQGGTKHVESSSNSYPPGASSTVEDSSESETPSSFQQTRASKYVVKGERQPSLSIAVIGATGELAKNKIFPALFALYYSGFLPENVCILGYSRKNLTDEDLRLMISSTLTCRVDHQKNCGDKMDAFLSQTYYINGGYDNKAGMSKLNTRMEILEEKSEANRIFYLSVPQEALSDVASSVASYAQTQKGWNRIIIEKPFGFDAESSQRLTQYLLSVFEENQMYRIDHLLGRNLIENLTVLRFSNLVFEPLWSRKYIRNVQVILSEDAALHTGKYFEGYGIIRDIVHSHILQTIALLAMEPPISLDGEDIRNEKVKLLRSIRSLEPSDVILGQYKSTAMDEVNVYSKNLTPAFFAAALYIDNSRWEGVPFMIRTGIGLIKHRVEIRIQFHHVPGNIYRERIGHNIDLATNELILCDAPNEAILLKINNKVPGLGLQLDASELNLLYKDKYNTEVPDSYEHLLLDVVDGDSHLFLRSDELAVAWKILTPILDEIDKKNVAPELYELGGRGPVGAYYLWAKHGVSWADD